MKNIKKIIAIFAVSATLVSCNSATILNENNGYFKKSNIEANVKDRFDANKDIAVSSKASASELSAMVSAEGKMHEAIVSYSYSILNQLMTDTMLQGPGFDYYKMKQFAIEIADRNVRQSDVIGKFTDQKNRYYVAIKLSKEKIRKQTHILFKERLGQVIKRLTEMKEGL